MYQIGDRRFPEIADLYQDPQGRQPREISDAPIQMVHQVNNGSIDLVIARAHYSPGGGAFPASFTAVTFNFANGVYADQALLPDDRIWRILVCGAAAVTTAPVMAVEYTGFAGVEGWGAGLAAYPYYYGNVDSGPYPDANPDMTGLILPYGGVVYVKRGGAADTGRLTCYAAGWPRATTPPF